MVDVFRENDEDSWDTAVRILEHYKETYNPAAKSDGEKDAERKA